jgi:protein gp37
MSDLFHEEAPLDVLQELFAVMRACPRHQFQILTKRHHRLAELSPHLDWPPNVWMGVSVEGQAYAHRLGGLRQAPAAVRFVSAEPLLSPLKLDLAGIHWVIVGGESGPRARPFDPDWARNLRDQCQPAGVAFFMKQVGGRRNHGGEERDIPPDLFIRQMPR